MKASIIVLSVAACIAIAPAALAQDRLAKASHQTASRKHHPPHAMHRTGAKIQSGYFAGAPRDASGLNRDLDASRQAGGGGGGSGM